MKVEIVFNAAVRQLIAYAGRCAGHDGKRTFGFAPGNHLAVRLFGNPNSWLLEGFYL
jgi:hypothetical protein